MTEFERITRYSYDQKLSQLKEKGYDNQHLRTLSYNGYDVIMTSDVGRNVHYYFYKNNKLVKMRNFVWRDDISLYAKRYIDGELKKGG